MFDYTIFPNNSAERFNEACKKIEKTYPNALKEPLLVDVDGTSIQNYTESSKSVTVYNDYEIGAVFVKSEINLDGLFSFA